MAHRASHRPAYDAMMHQGRLPLQPSKASPPPGRAAPVSGVARSFKGELDEVLPLLPEFDRQPFATEAGAPNAFLDVIVRREAALWPAVPVGVVSTRYSLLSHYDIADAVRTAVAAIGVHPREMQAEAHLTGYGARMALFVRLPRSYDFDPGDGHPLALRLLCLNSVDGSSTLRILLGWFRFVCANGLIVGTTRSEWRLVHRDGMDPAGVREVLSRGLELAERERVALKVWRTLAVPIERFVSFADDELAKAWGVKAAARFLHIATTGFDGELTLPFELGPPHAKTILRTRRVPGCLGHSTSVYDAAQILAWIAKDRRDQHERVDRLLQIPELMQMLLARR